ncbi:MAG: site-2 protease family protein, partial [Clostridiales bacterium]|nr:site-2 protease family protein [Clostridiales bacterium]
TALGDRNPKKNGFLTFNPFRYFEPVGFFLMMAFNVGWGQPVPTSPFYYKNKRAGIALTYLTPIIVNLLVGMITIFLLSLFSDYEFRSFLDWISVNEIRMSLFLMSFSTAELSTKVIIALITAGYFFGMLNISLALFNLIPIAPLAMSKIIHIFISPEASMRMNHYEKPMQIILILLLIFGLHSAIIFPITEFIIGTVTI